jgi:hypothetical protein
MKILMRLPGEENYNQTLLAFGELLARGGAFYPKIHTPENICAWFNGIAPVLFQMEERPKASRPGYYALGSPPPAPERKWPEHLKLREDRVYIGDAAKAEMSNWQKWGNSDGVLIDFLYAGVQVNIV